jgi:hypothetical protein
MEFAIHPRIPAAQIVRTVRKISALATPRSPTEAVNAPMMKAKRSARGNAVKNGMLIH